MTSAATPTPDREALCRRCGRCCYEKILLQDHVFTTGTPCAHLDVATRLCRVYADRHRVNPRCLTVEQGVEWGVFPADCPYVAGLKGYHPAEEGTLTAEIVEAIEQGRLRSWREVREAMRRAEGG